MGNEETKDIPGQNGGQEQQEEKVVTEFASPVKFGGIEVKSEADVLKAQEAYTAQAARATRAEQALAELKKQNENKGQEQHEEHREEPKPKELTFLEKQAKLVEFNKNVDTYTESQLADFKSKGNNKYLVEAFGEDAKRTIRNLVSEKGEKILPEVKVGAVFDAVIAGVISKGRTPENIEAYNKAINIRNLKEGSASVKDVEEVFAYFKNLEGKPKVNGEKIDTRGFEGKGDGAGTFEQERQAIKTKVAKGELSPRDGRSAIKALQAKHVKLNRR